MRPGLIGYWDSLRTDADAFDHNLTNHYGLSEDDPRLQMVHKKMESIIAELDAMQWIVELLSKETL